MAEPKTKLNDADVYAFIASVEDEQKREDCIELTKIISGICDAPPKMWGTSIVGFGTYTYTYASGRKGDWMITGFSPRKQNLTLYVMSGFAKEPELMKNLGKYKTGKSCLYVKSLDDINKNILAELISNSVARMKSKWPCKP
jgi:hypothetical protein